MANAREAHVMADIFKIVKIEEPDFGCEGVPEGELIRDEVTILGQNGKEFIMRVEDKLLYEKDLNEGDSFMIDESGNMVKI